MKYFDLVKLYTLHVTSHRIMGLRVGQVHGHCSLRDGHVNTAHFLMTGRKYVLYGKPYTINNQENGYRSSIRVYTSHPSINNGGGWPWCINPYSGIKCCLNLPSGYRHRWCSLWYQLMFVGMHLGRSFHGYTASNLGMHQNFNTAVMPKQLGYELRFIGYKGWPGMQPSRCGRTKTSLQ
jgi:hypothetical protein